MKPVFPSLSERRRKAVVSVQISVSTCAQDLTWALRQLRRFPRLKLLDIRVDPRGRHGPWPNMEVETPFMVRLVKQTPQLREVNCLVREPDDDNSPSPTRWFQCLAELEVALTNAIKTRKRTQADMNE